MSLVMQEFNVEMSDEDQSSVPLILQDKGYELGKTIGEGSYCKVKTAIRRFNDGRCMAMACKIVNKRKASNEFVTKFLPREINIIRNLRHPNIIHVFEVFESPEQVFIFTNICEKGDLLEYIKQKKALSQDIGRHFF